MSARRLADFVTGFLDSDGNARGRPVGVAIDPLGGALLIADDLSNTLWRVAPRVGTRPVAAPPPTSRAQGT